MQIIRKVIIFEVKIAINNYFLISITLRLLFLNFRLFFFAIFSIAVTTIGFAQIGDSIKPIPKINKEFLVVAHIVYNQDTVPGIDSTTIATILNQVNVYYSPIGASFKLCTVDYIYNYQYNNLTSSMRKDMLATYWVPNRINFFFVDAMIDLPKYCGNADLGGITSTSKVGVVLLKNNLCFTAHTVGHELGHYFSLEHTFEHSHGLELVNEINCASTGDGICDTPADPFIDGEDLNTYINTETGTCIYINDKQDANGQYYNPDVCNIMSYYGCGHKFSQGQYEKMVNYYLKNPFEW